MILRSSVFILCAFSLAACGSGSSDSKTKSGTTTTSPLIGGTAASGAQATLPTNVPASSAQTTVGNGQPSNQQAVLPVVGQTAQVATGPTTLLRNNNNNNGNAVNGQGASSGQVAQSAQSSKQNNASSASAQANTSTALARTSSVVAQQTSAAPVVAPANQPTQQSTKLSPTQISKLPQLTQNQIAMNKITVRCKTANTCSASVGVLVAASVAKGTVKDSTAFLISDDTIVTTTHSLPKNLQINGVSTNGQIEVVFPAVDGFPAEHINGQTVIETISTDIADGAGHHLDVAYIKLERPVTPKSNGDSRPLLTISRGGLTNNQLVSVASVVNSGKSLTEKLLSVQHCKVVQGPVSGMNISSDLAPIFALQGCEIVEQGSGSPVITGDNQVAGIISTSSDTQAVAALNSRGSEGRVIHISTGTNFACVSDPNFINDAQNSAACLQESAVLNTAAATATRTSTVNPVTSNSTARKSSAACTRRLFSKFAERIS